MNSKGTNKPKIFLIPFLIVLIIVLAMGIVIGYGIWGKKEEKTNAKRLLSQIAEFILSYWTNTEAITSVTI
jgi:flagellar basal body-associated protein FliL